jgi:peroxin-13
MTAMVSVAEQFGNLRNTLGSVLGIFTILRWMRTLLAKITGRPPPADATALTPTNFASFMSGGRNPLPATLPDGSPAPPKPSKKPFIMFAVAVFGLPYLMGKLIRALARSQEAEQLRQQQQLLAQGGHPQTTDLTLNPATGVLEPTPVDPRKLDFCRVLYDYSPQNTSNGTDLSVTRGDLVAILSKTDPTGAPSEWWRCRARDGKVGYLPSPYLETIQRRPAQEAITAGSAPGSRTATLVGDMGGLRTKSLSSVSADMVGGKGKVKVPVGTGKSAGDITVESFQKSAFYS